MKKSKPNLFILILLFGLLVNYSCMQQNNFTEKSYVLHANITSSKPVTASLIECYEVDGIWHNEPIYTAKMYLFENGVEVVQLQPTGMGNYKSNYTAIENKSYRIMAISFNNDTIFGDAILPGQVKMEGFLYDATLTYIDTVYYNVGVDSVNVVDTTCMINLNFSFIDLKEIDNVYQVTVTRIDKGCTSYGYESEANCLLSVNKIETNPEIFSIQRSKVNSYYYNLFDDAHNGEEIKVAVQFYDSEIAKFPVHYAVSFVNLSKDTYTYYIDLELNTPLTQSLGWDMGFSLKNIYYAPNDQMFVPNSNGNTITNGYGFICASAGIIDTVVVELPE